MKNYKISVIIPVYNVEKYLKRCLDSVINQAYKNLEIILVDDGSSDGSSDICDKYAKKDNRITVFHKENAGVSSARNIGLENCSGDYISFIDADDWIEKGFYEYVNSNLNDNDLLIFDYYIAFEDTRVRKHLLKQSYYFSKEEAMLELAIGRLQSYPVNKIYKKKLFNNLKFPNNRNYEDQAIMHLLIDKCKKILYIPNAYYNYYQNQDSISHIVNEKNYKDYLAANFQRLKFFKKFYPDLYEYQLNTIYSAIAKLCWLYFNKKAYKVRYMFLRKIVLKKLRENLFNSKISYKTKTKMLLTLMNINVIKILYSKNLLLKLIERYR